MNAQSLVAKVWSDPAPRRATASVAEGIGAAERAAGVTEVLMLRRPEGPSRSMRRMNAISLIPRDARNSALLRRRERGKNCGVQERIARQNRPILLSETNLES
jgi:hypothetical protein